MWEKRRRRTGLCHFSDYYVGRPALRSTTESYKETVFELQPDQIMVRSGFHSTAELCLFNAIVQGTEPSAGVSKSQSTDQMDELIDLRRESPVISVIHLPMF